MEQIKQAAEQLKSMIKASDREIDNPALVMSIVSELEFFIENVGGEEE